LLLWVVALSLGLNRPVGIAFVALLVGYMVYAYLQERRSTGDHTAAYDRGEALRGVDPALTPRAATGGGIGAWLLPVGMALGGLIVIIVGGRLLVDGAVELARMFGMSEAVIGLTIVAVGTSAPELVTSVVAAVRRQADVAIGNILGSNIYNVLGIAGVTGLIAPTAVPRQMVGFDIPLMIAATVLLLVFAWTGARISRREGAIFVFLYAAYVGWLVVQA
jgi:cation:H+ antiporter